MDEPTFTADAIVSDPSPTISDDTETVPVSLDEGPATENVACTTAGPLADRSPPTDAVAAVDSADPIPTESRIDAVLIPVIMSDTDRVAPSAESPVTEKLEPSRARPCITASLPSEVDDITDNPPPMREDPADETVEPIRTNDFTDIELEMVVSP